MDFVDRCRQLIAIDTSPGQGTLKAAQWLQGLALSSGLSCEIHGDQDRDGENANILIRPTGQRAGAEFMFQTHLDTNDAGPFELWKKNRHNPFDAAILDGSIYGLGSADCKLDFLCKLEALSIFTKQGGKGQGLSPVLVGTFGEAQGMVGALRLIRKNLVAGKVALVGEPSELKVFVAGKGSARVQIRIPFESDETIFREEHNLRESTSTMSKSFHGKATHASTPHLGESAIQKLFDYLRSLPEDLVLMEVEGGGHYNTVPATAFLEIDPFSGFSFPMSKKLRHFLKAVDRLDEKFKVYQDADFNPPKPTMVIGTIKAFERHLEMEGVVGIPPKISNETYESWIKEFAEQCQAVGGEFRVSDYKRPYRTDSQSILVKTAGLALKEVGVESSIGTHSSTNEASLFTRVGIECVSFGPGVRDGNIHTPNEHVKIEDLKSATQFYLKMMERFCQ